MKKGISVAVLLFCGLVLCGFALNAHARDNLLRNPSFEEWDARHRLPPHWRRGSGEIDQFEHSKESEKEDGVSVRLLAPPDKSASIFQDVDIEGEQLLALSARFKTEGSGLAWASFHAFDIEGNRITPRVYWSNSFKDRPEWTDLRWDFTTPPGTRRVRMILSCRSTDKKPGSAWIDEVSLRREGITLGNKSIELFIDPLGGGGRIRSLKLKDGHNREHAYWDIPGTPGGLAADILPADRYPGILRDALYEIVERDDSGRRTLLAYSPAQPEYAGLRIEKEFIVPEEASYVEVRLTLVNAGGGNLSPAVRIQNIVPVGKGVFTYSSNNYVGMYDLAAGVGESGAWEMGDMKGGWIAYSLPEDRAGVVFIFDEKEVEKAFCWLTQTGINTIEWAYREQALAPGERWRTSYRIVPIASGAPVFSVDEEIIAGLLPLDIPADGGARMDITPYGGSRKWSLEVEGRSQQTGANKFRHVFESEPMKAEQVELPWKGERLMDIAMTAETKDSRHKALLHEQARFVRAEKGLVLPDMPVEEPALAEEVASFFPFGNYLRGGHGGDAPERGPRHQHWRRALRLFRKNYMNTVTGELQMTEPVLAEVQRTGKDRLSEKLRKHDMRLIPRQQSFSHSGAPFIENVTREQAVAEWKKRSYPRPPADIGLYRLFAEEYNDIILAYDISDEPAERFMPWYLHMRSVFNEINPKRPAMPILMWHQMAYMPYVPIYYGDIYPIYTEERGRDPWAAGRNTRQLVDRARGEKPVWIMPQAFGWERWALPDEAETRYMAYAFFANGAKALIYHGANTQPRWLINVGYDRCFMSTLGTWTREWHVLGEVSKHLTAVGPATMDYLPANDTDITVDCGEIRREKYSGPAIIANVLASRGKGGGLLLVVQNQDMDASHSGTLRLPAVKGDARVLYDLKELKQITRIGAGGASVDISLEQPGDALLLFLGTEEETARVVSAVHRHRYLNEKAIFNIDLELAENNDADISRARGTFNEAQAAFAAGSYGSAHHTIVKAQAEIESIIEKSGPLGPAKADGETARQLLSEVTELYGIHIETAAPRELAQKVRRGQRLPAGTGIRPAEIDVMVEKTAELIRRLNQAEDRLYQGQAAQVADELKVVAGEADGHLREVRAHLN